MSLILDALKKLDREKSSRRNGTANIALEIVKPDLPRSGKRILLYGTAIFFTAVIAAAITYAVMAQFGYLPKSSPPLPVNPPAPSQQVAVTPVSPAPVPHDTREESGGAPSKIQSNAENKKPAISVNEKQAKRKAIPREADIAFGNVKKSAEQVSKGPAADVPSLKLSGIIWHEEPKERRAMINGTIATEGSFVEGVKVVEIHSSKVRFSFNGKPFEISMGK